MLYRLTEEAELELSEAFQWYESRRKGLGADFLLVLEAAFNMVVRNPYSYPVRHKEYRVAPVQRFPYLVVYEIAADEVCIYAVFHTSRSVGKLFKRLANQADQ